MAHLRQPLWHSFVAAFDYRDGKVFMISKILLDCPPIFGFGAFCLWYYPCPTVVYGSLNIYSYIFIYYQVRWRSQVQTYN